MNFDDLSNRLNDFNRYYETGLKPFLDELEAKRKKASATFYKVLIGLIIVLILSALLIRNSDITFFLLVPAFLISGYFYQKINAVKDAAKLEVMSELCKFLDMHYKIRADDDNIWDYKNLSLVPAFDEKSLEDEFLGEVGGVGFNLFEAKLVNVSTDRKGRKSRTTVFRGLLAKFDFHKNFSGTTIVKEDLTAFGNFLTGWTNKGERVKLEDPIFENKFEVYSTDQVEARYLLTPAFMERILGFTTLPNVDKIRFAFHERSLFLALKRDKDSFEGDGSELNDIKYIKNMIKDLSIIFDTVKKLKLDIQTKV